MKKMNKTNILLLLLTMLLIIYPFAYASTSRDFVDPEVPDGVSMSEKIEVEYAPIETETIKDIQEENVETLNVETPIIEEVEPTPEPVVEETENPTLENITDEEIELIAKTLYGEYRGKNKLQQAGVVWTILNRCDAWDKSIKRVVTAPNQFMGYNANNPVLPYLRDITIDVLTRWQLEKQGETDVGRVLPSDYLWFAANKDNTANNFRNAFKGGTRWDWHLPNPYEN